MTYRLLAPYGWQELLRERNSRCQNLCTTNTAAGRPKLLTHPKRNCFLNECISIVSRSDLPRYARSVGGPMRIRFHPAGS